jgi:hypothetical protein
MSPWSGDIRWILLELTPYERIDPIDVDISLLDTMFAIYKQTYRELNAPTAVAFFEFFTLDPVSR